jgi:peptide/nickel transport system substrate-binding protein
MSEIEQVHPWQRYLRIRLTRRHLVRTGAAASFGLIPMIAGACGSNRKATPAPTTQASQTTTRPTTAAATAQPAQSPMTAVKHGSLTAGFSNGSVGQTLSPNSTALWATEFYALYDQLVRLEPSGQPTPKLAPALATSWENASPTRWIFHLRTDAKWSDGQTVTANDVKFTYDYIKDPANKSAIIGRVGTVDTVEAIDAATVAINTKTPDPLIPRYAFFIHIMPQHYLGDPKYGDQAMATKPIGSGAYAIDSYSQGSLIKLKKNPYSWRGTRGVDAVEVRIIPEDTTRVAALQTGEVDLIDQVPLNLLGQLSQMKDRKTFFPPPTGYAGWDVEYFDPPYNDKRVRLAFAHAIDYDAIAKTIFFGVPKVMQGQMLSSPTFGFNPNLKPYSYDPKMAKQLLQAAGVQEGFKTRMEFRPDVFQLQAFAEACAKYLQDLGIQTELVPIQINVWRDGLYGRRKRAPFMYDSWSSSAALEASIALQWMLSTNPGKFYNNADFDAAYQAAVSEFDDNKRLQDYWKATEIMNGDPPGLWIVEGAVSAAYRSDKIAVFNPIGSPPTYFDEIVLA